MEKNTVLKMSHISKAFVGVKVLTDVEFELRRGEVHALIGANGAGKSTLMKVLNGIYVNYEGSIYLNDEKVTFRNPWDAQQKGISMIHQELDLVMTMDVASNIYLGREILNGKKVKHLDRDTMHREAQKLLDELHFDIRADAMTGSLSPANQQLVLIARSVSTDARVIVMDEPTSSLSHQETMALFDVIRKLKALGKSIIYISHYLDEIFSVTDRVTVLRDGKKITTAETSACTTDLLVEWMIGEKKGYDQKRIRPDISEKVVLDIRNYSQKYGIVKDVSFQLHKGEVLGIAGVVGSGRTELAKMIYGAEPVASGEMLMNGTAVKISEPFKAVGRNIALVPEERKKEGLIKKRTIGDNISLIDYRNHCKRGFIDYKSAKKRVQEMIQYMNIVCTGQDQEITSLSGGNQQKAVMGRCVVINPEILILDQPTRGVDVGAKNEIYELIDRLAREGMSIILISDELEEILNLSDRILVMQKGKIIKTYNNHTDNLEKNKLLTVMVS